MNKFYSVKLLPCHCGIWFRNVAAGGLSLSGLISYSGDPYVKEDAAFEVVETKQDQLKTTGTANFEQIFQKGRGGPC